MDGCAAKCRRAVASQPPRRDPIAARPFGPRRTVATRGAGRRASSVTTLASSRASCGSTRLATQPANDEPAGMDRVRGEQRMIKAAQAYGDDQQHRQRQDSRDVEHVAACVERNPHAAGALDDDAVGARRRADRRPRGCARGRSRRPPRRRRGAARWLARRQTDCARRSGASTLPAAASAATSSFTRPRAMPAATGFMPTARAPAPPSARSSAHATTVLPTPVSVPVTKMPAGRRAAWAIQSPARGAKRTIARPSAVTRGSGFQAWPYTTS